ncbi:MAG: hypothetical protein ACK4S4_04690 [Pyrinomonadaceae bacterium]
MKIISLLILVCAFSTVNAQTAVRRTPPRGPVAAATPAPSNASQLPIRRVILYSNGVAYIERLGVVSGNAEVNLSFKQSQVDDVLKSMVVLDLGKGRIGAVSYNSSAPASARTAEIPFEVESKTDGDGGIFEVLSQLQGAKVAVVTASGASAAGSILTVEKRVAPADKDRPAAAQRFLVIASESGELSSFDLATVRSVKLLDDATRRDINEFADATASTRRRDAKTITVTSEGTGQREMIVSYTIAAPIWKTTYRVVLGDDGKPFFQGWAIVDNVSDEDWQNVSLSLVSGSPVSFIQNLQKPLYRYRPVIPIPDDLNLDPQVYDPEVGVGEGSGVGDGSGSGSGSGGGRGNAVEVNGSMAQSNLMLAPGVSTSVSNVLVSEDSGVQTAATGSEIGDLFEYRISDPVTVPRNRSALIPIVQTKMEGERISVYNESVRAERPMGGMMLTNTTPLTFEGGSLTVLDRDAYAGEALMERLKPRERRLISFALDLGTFVIAEQKQDREPAKLIKAINGVFEVHYFQTDEKIYTIANQTDREKVVYVEHPVKKDWGLAESSAKPDIVTEKYYRFRVELKPFEKQSLRVVERQGLMDSYQLRSITRDQIDLFVKRRYIDDATRTRLEKLISIRTQIAEIDRRLEAFDDEVEKIEADQKRLRENIEALAKTPEAKQLIARYIAKAGEQETQIEQMNAERKALSAQRANLESQLAAEIRSFELK